MAAERDHIEKLEVIWFSSEELEEGGQILNHSPGKTPVMDMVDRHVDACHLDGVRLLRIAEKISEAIRRKNSRRFSKKKVEELLVDAVQQRRVGVDALKPNVKERVGALLQS